MQSMNEVIEKITAGDPDISVEQASVWADYLCQLNGCHLFSVASPDKDKAEWLRERTAGIGGSEIAAIMGESHWSSPHKVWMSKIGIFESNNASQPEAAQWGNILETVVATEWGRRNNRKWVHIPVILQHDTQPWLLANIDGFTLDDDGKTITGILEIKTTSAYNKDVWENGPLPFNYICQANWYCGITGLNEFELVCLVGGQALFSYAFPFDDELFSRETAAAEDFWNNYVQKGIEPQLTDVDAGIIKDSDKDPDFEKPALVLDDDESERLTEAYCQIREKIKGLTKVKEALYAQIYQKLDNGTQAITQGHTITLGTTARRKCNFDALEIEYPEAYKNCVATNISFSMRIK